MPAQAGWEGAALGRAEKRVRERLCKGSGAGARMVRRLYGPPEQPLPPRSQQEFTPAQSRVSLE